MPGLLGQQQQGEDMEGTSSPVHHINFPRPEDMASAYKSLQKRERV